jgi:UDPglucose--hexose-1-phosphate uridylyltransferase
VRKTSALLADGRRIIYFDDRDDPPHYTADSRQIEAVTTRSELRHDPLLDEWVVIASHRQGRAHLPPREQCPLCPSTPSQPTEIPSSSYDVVVIENRFPTFAGRCEVVCFTSEHDASFASLSGRRVRTVLEAWVDRTLELSSLGGVEQVFCFENRGREIGVTLSHPHGQIYACPSVTPRTARMLSVAARHAASSGTNLFDGVVAAESMAATRVVARSSHWIAFVPAAARWPFEVHLYPNARVPDLPALGDAARDDFAVVYLDVLGRLDRLFGVPMPYVSAWHQAPVRQGRELFGLHLELFSTRRAPDMLKHPAGAELAMGMFINDIQPERAAELLRQA